MNQKNKPTELSYYGLYLLSYLKENHPDKADDAEFIETCADQAGETYEQARREGYPVAGAHELAMLTLLEGLYFSKYTLLTEVLENEFADEVPEEQVPAFATKLLPLVENVFAIYPLSDDFAQSPEYDLLYTELTGAVVLYLEAYGV